MIEDYAKGCGLTAIFFMALGTAFCVKFFDASSHQSVGECVARMSRPILAKTQSMPSDAVLRAKDARIEHDLYGNESQARAIAKAFEERGWRVTVGPQNEIGWAAKVFEDPASFRHQAARRVSQLCTVAAKNNMKYRAWWLNAPDIADYVAQ